MAYLKVFFVIAIFVFCAESPHSAKAEELNITNEIRRMLFQKMPNIPIGEGYACDSENNVQGPSDFVKIFRCVFSFTKVRLTNVDVIYSDVKPAPIPISIVTETFPYLNCNTTDKSKVDDSKTWSVTAGNTVTRNTTVTEGESVTDTTSLTVPIKAVAFQMSKTATVSFTSQQSEGEQLSQQETTTITQRITKDDLAPRTAYIISFIRKTSNGYIDVTGRLSIEADVSLRMQLKNDGSFANGVRSLGSLTSMLPSPADRIIEVHGQVWNAQSLAVERTETFKSLSDADCKQSPLSRWSSFPTSFAAPTSFTAVASNLKSPIDQTSTVPLSVTSR